MTELTRVAAGAGLDVCVRRARDEEEVHPEVETIRPLVKGGPLATHGAGRRGDPGPVARWCKGEWWYSS